MRSAFGVEHGQLSKAVDPLIRQHGLRGAPAGVDRDTRQQIWEARAKHLNVRRDRWDRTSKTARAVETGTGAVAGGVGATLAAHQLREAYRGQNPAGFARAETRASSKVLRHGLRHPRTAAPVARAAQAALHGRPSYRLMAVGAGSAVASAGARRGRIMADKRKRKYSSASGGIASGTARRMREYDVSKSAFGVQHELAKSDKPERAFDHRGIAATAASMTEPINGPRGSIARPGASSLRRDYNPERNRGRRANAYSAIAAGGSVGSGVGAVRTGRAGRRDRRAAAGHFAEANAQFRAARQQGVQTEQRLARHNLSLYDGGKGGLPGTRQNLAGTHAGHHFGEEHYRAGFAAQGRHAESAASAARNLRRSKGLGVAAVGLAGASYGIRRHRGAAGRSYGYL